MSELNTDSLEKAIKPWVQRFKDMGIGLSDLKPLTPKERKERDLKDAIRFTSISERNKRKRFVDSSLWPGGNELNFTFNDWEPTEQINVEEARKVGNKAFQMARDLERDLFNVYLFGTVGAGKTSLALAMLDKVSTKRTTMFVSVVEWRELKFRSFDDDQASKFLGYVEKAMKDVDVLLLDDLGKETENKTAQTVARMLFDLADARRGKSTIITSNEDATGIAVKYDAATVSRLLTKDINHVISVNKLNDVRKV